MRIAMTGNPNSGKTTMYNALTGRSEHVGNWAGVTVDKKEHPSKRIIMKGKRNWLQWIFRERIPCLLLHQRKALQVLM